jgi:Flp pilus assembly protein TadD
LLDYWPLRRLTLEAGKLKWVLLEKVPLFALTLASAAITIVAQKAGGAISAGERGGFGITVESGPAEQIANALVSYVMYMVQTIYPSGLGIFYPHPAYSGEPIPAWEIIGSAAVLIAVSVWAIRLSHERPYLLVGWLWFIGMLVPVIGLLQVGLQARADRYTYLPQIGLCIALTWYIADVVPPRKLVMPAILVLAALAVLAWHQIQRWHDAETVMGHALTVAPPTWLTEISYGTILLERNRVEEAIPHLRSAFRLGTGHAQSRHCLVMGLTIQGDNLARNGEFAKAASSFEEALALDPESDTTRKQLLMVLQTLGIMKARQGRPDEAAVWFHRAVELDPTNPTAHYNLGRALLDAGRPREASACFKCVLELDPGNAAARANLQRLEQEKSR